MVSPQNSRRFTLLNKHERFLVLSHAKDTLLGCNYVILSIVEYRVLMGARGRGGREGHESSVDKVQGDALTRMGTQWTKKTKCCGCIMMGSIGPWV